ncbi:unnamed protein product [Didymodactylos carnosus]|uniref:Uncharacterized protein n=1 Tax=Didymodactylos carnosus TaxID=1234261 RepID=A0A816C5W2_9BILA|nr:unnamed protein product [Didymodactylos carnosus]CAF1619873.1 unnamed protein product [Didymodactylos carnosus]CAF4344564.1 unnamed protein product [Didymodactylos carnosus]CAF4509171.1 unnamed protein product [Didymodactylos carnosus]
MDEIDNNERQGGQVSDISEDENDNNERQDSQVSDISADNDLEERRGAGAQDEEDENIFVPFTQYVIRDDIIEGELASSQERNENGDSPRRSIEKTMTSI